MRARPRAPVRTGATRLSSSASVESSQRRRESRHGSLSPADSITVDETFSVKSTSAGSCLARGDAQRAAIRPGLAASRAPGRRTRAAALFRVQRPRVS